MTGPADAIWDDGEWISWGWINDRIHERELAARLPEADLDLIEIFEDLVYYGYGLPGSNRALPPSLWRAG